MVLVTISNVCLSLSPAVPNIRLMIFACLFPLWVILDEGDLGNISLGKCYWVEHLAHYEKNADDRWSDLRQLPERARSNVVHRYY